MGGLTDHCCFGEEQHMFLLAVGGIGMLQNGIVATVERAPGSRNIPLEHVATIETTKVMDGLMDLERALVCGRRLCEEIFPGELEPEETGGMVIEKITIPCATRIQYGGFRGAKSIE
ncbi:hypothetical protein QBC46DRAFT_412522 [Diplogelasinospora grovesii]|uniref:Uncharacterized protein n=1 Tax=Diplogelasinospora grovesii TaxID=303347 RepID=A0AAN6N0I7_9PEZI|nr:hypothetical protein QBC46DRAFT_412522 [Diplogelasinospora grovesii]